MFKCSTCKEMLPRDSFGKDSQASRGFSYRCKNCMRKKNNGQREDPEVRERRRLQTMAWREANPDKVKALREKSKDSTRDAYLERTYKLSLESYEEMLATQEGGCALCQKTPEENGKKLSVDHDHACCPGKRSCGKCVRGLLCDACNHSIGRMDDDVERLQAAINYIKEHRGR